MIYGCANRNCSIGTNRATKARITGHKPRRQRWRLLPRLSSTHRLSVRLLVVFIYFSVCLPVCLHLCLSAWEGFFFPLSFNPPLGSLSYFLSRCFYSFRTVAVVHCSWLRRWVRMCTHLSTLVGVCVCIASHLCLCTCVYALHHTCVVDVCDMTNDICRNGEPFGGPFGPDPYYTYGHNHLY